MVMLKGQLFDIESLSDEMLNRIFELANGYAKNGIERLSDSGFMVPLFYEPSTRTTMSFEVAAKSLGLDVLNFSLANSALKKGESELDTIENLMAMGIDLFVIRHQSDVLIKTCIEKFATNAHFINAGSGVSAHPTQALLDVFTLSQLAIPFSELKIAIVGDLLHSRVVRSLLKLFKRVGIQNYRLVSPASFALDKADNNKVFDDLGKGITGVDVVMTLRVQKERFSKDSHFNVSAYQQDFCIKKHHLEKYCPKAKIMHPGPINLGVEIDEDLTRDKNALILTQVKNGVFVRAALIKALLE